ncbi:MAG: 2-oxoacid:acceptor oxidoreductase subunit alpha [Deltaproteobacteria bacterium]|nr:2-oxoacid:acceptor oxidoreductase subunit alpha [Deltaproteobacteria bacterium]
MADIRFIQGNEACALGAIYAGCRFFAGYPITPSSEVAEMLSEELPLVDGVFIQMEDEIAAMAAIIGASLAGKKSMTATSGPGMSLKLENLGYACITEVPCVIVNVQRGGPSTGLPTSPAQADIMQARWGAHGDHPIIALCPSSVSEMFTETVRAFNLSEMFRTPVIVLSDEIIGHMREKIVIPQEGEIPIVNRKKPKVPPHEYKPFKGEEDFVPPMAAFGEGYRYHVTGLSHNEEGFPIQSGELVHQMNVRMHNKIYKNLDKIIKNEVYMCDDAEIIIFALGGAARSSKGAIRHLREEGIKAGLFRPLTIWPFPEEDLRRVCSRAKNVLVVEMNLGQIVFEVERVLSCMGVKIDGMFDSSGEPFTPLSIVRRVKEIFQR